MTQYNHALSLAFEVISNDEEGEDITIPMLKAALQKRVENIDSGGDLEWEQACLPPWDTYEMEAKAPDGEVPATTWAVWAWQAYRDKQLVERTEDK